MPENNETETKDFSINEGPDTEDPIRMGRDPEERLNKKQKKAKKRGDPTPLPLDLQREEDGRQDPIDIPKKKLSLGDMFRRAVARVVSLE